VVSPWSGYPADWNTPNWTSNNPLLTGINRLVDVAWACLDMNSSVLASMPVYHMQSGRVVDSTTWMTNPDPDIYSSWQEFAKQLFWDYMMGEAFVLPMATYYDGYPARFRVVPPWLVNVELQGGRRVYNIGSQNVTDKILHIRYQSNTSDARGHGPLEAAGARLTAITLLQRYANNLAETGGVPLYWMELQRQITESEGRDILDRWIETRSKNAGHPALVSAGAKLNQAHAMSAHDMALMELTNFNESRVAVLLGVPPFLVGLSGAAGSLTYSNVESLFDFHDRSSLRPKANAVMPALSQWALPNGQSAELNRDDYTRPPLKDRATANKTYIEAGVLKPDEVRLQERYHGEPSPTALTGGTDNG
jgi:HK97 family phage portal protein